jgi:hypothetical protein
MSWRMVRPDQRGALALAVGLGRDALLVRPACDGLRVLAVGCAPKELADDLGLGEMDSERLILSKGAFLLPRTSSPRLPWRPAGAQQGAQQARRVPAGGFCRPDRDLVRPLCTILDSLLPRGPVGVAVS